METKEHYLKYRTALFQELEDARACLELHLHLKEQLINGHSVLLDFPAYFRITLASLSRTAIMIIANVFEERKKSSSKTIHKFLNYINHPQIFSDDPTFCSKPKHYKQKIDEHKELLKGHRDHIKIIIDFRDNYLAHFGDYFLKPDRLDEIDITFRLLNDLVNLGYKILDESPGGPCRLYAPLQKGYKENIDLILHKVKKYDEIILPTIQRDQREQKEQPTKPYFWDLEHLKKLKKEQDAKKKQ